MPELIRKQAGPVLTAILGGLGVAAKGAGGLVSGAANTAVGGGRVAFLALSDLAKRAAALAVAVPVGTGLAAGVAASRMTSPAERDLDVQEKQIVNTRLKAMTEENIRRLTSDLAAYRDLQKGV